MNRTIGAALPTPTPTLDLGESAGALRVVEEDADEPPEPGAEQLSARVYITDPAWRSQRPVEVVGSEFQAYGLRYYATVVADARGAPTRPTLRSLVAAPRRAVPRPRGGAIGVLVEPASALAPSNPAGIEALQDAIHRAGLQSRVLTVHEPERLRGLRSLFVRATTAGVGPVMDLVRRADALGIALLEPPEVIVRCCDKVFQAERFAAWGVPTPHTLVVHPGDAARIEAALGYPCVLKLPDSSGARDVHRVGDRAALEATLARLGTRSAVLIAQAWTPSAFDWRIGVLDGEPIFASRYEMVPGHWQIHLWRDGEMRGAGPDRAVPLHDVPPAVLAAALRAAASVGGGLMGVDVKEVGGEALVMEVNDTPTIFRHEEDAVIGTALYDRLVASLLARVGKPR